MKRIVRYISIAILFLYQNVEANGLLGQDTFSVHCVGHGSLHFEYKNLVIHVDPYSTQADYSLLPDADIILITHGHGDHYDLNALNKIKKDDAIMVFTQAVKALGTYTDTSIVIKNGDSIAVKGIPIKAVPAYNLDASYHPKGTGNGYVLTFGEKRVYIAGDTENIPEMGNLGYIDIAFLPMNLPYTMTTAMAAEAAKKVKPDILYIYHFGSSDTAALRNSLKGEDMEIRIGKSVFYESDKRQPKNPNSLKLTFEKKTSFYPNPVKEYMILYNTSNGSTLSITDMAGRIMLKQYLDFEGEHTINMKVFKRGMYLLTIRNNSKLLLKE